MTIYLTTSEIAAMYGLADSTVRHYRASGRLVPTRSTPGGHARYAVRDVVAALGDPAGTAPAIAGLEHEDFLPAGQHDLRSTGRGGTPAAEFVALGTREPEAAAPGRARWGGRLLRPRGRTAA